MAMHFLEHNKHYITIDVFGTPIKACARCLGSIIGELAAFFIILPFMALEVFDFAMVFTLSWVLAGFAIVDWATVKAKLREGSNTMRFVTGYLLAFGAMIYLLLLPIPFLTRILSLSGYGLVFVIVQYIVDCKEHGLSLRNPIRKNLVILSASAMPLTVGQIGCGHTGGCSCACCPCGSCGSCCCSPLCCCVGVCPIICIMKSVMDRGAKQKQPDYGPPPSYER